MADDQRIKTDSDSSTLSAQMGAVVSDGALANARNPAAALRQV